MRNILILWASIFVLISSLALNAQGLLPRVVCGDTLTGNFTTNWQYVSYLISLQPGDTIRVSASRFGDYIVFEEGYTGIFAPSETEVTRVDRDSELVDMSSGILSEPGDYTIQFQNQNAFGSFTFSVTCTRNGEAYDETQPTPDPIAPIPDLQPQNITLGYPGVAPVDFSGIGLTALTPQFYGVLIASSIPVDGSGVMGYSIEGVKGDILEISAQRSQGNLPVGFVVFAEPNIPVFIAGPVSSSTFSTEIMLPQDGNYVIGLFRMGDAPVEGQVTEFQVLVSLNPESAAGKRYETTLIDSLRPVPRTHI